MFSKLGYTEIALILVVVLVIFGPSKLPQLGKAVGETIRSFKKSAGKDADAVLAEDKLTDA